MVIDEIINWAHKLVSITIDCVLNSVASRKPSGHSSCGIVLQNLSQSSSSNSTHDCVRVLYAVDIETNEVFSLVFIGLQFRFCYYEMYCFEL